jgi:hypothetical protein
MQAGRKASLYVVDGGSQGRILLQTSPTNTRVSGGCVQGRPSGDGQRLHDTVCVRHQRGVTSPFRQVAWRAQVSRSRPSAVSVALRSGTQVTGYQRRLGSTSNMGRLMMMVNVTAAAVAYPAGARCRLTWRGGAWKKRRLLRGDGVSCGQLVEWGTQPGGHLAGGLAARRMDRRWAPAVPLGGGAHVGVAPPVTSVEQR